MKKLLLLFLLLPSVAFAQSEIPTAAQVWKSFNATSAQTGAAIWTPASGNKIAIRYCQIGSYGTTAARVIIWAGTSGDTSYTEGTDQAVFKGSFAPSTTGTPGAILQPSKVIFVNTANNVLKVTTDAAISIDIVCYGYEF